MASFDSINIVLILVCGLIMLLPSILMLILTRSDEKARVFMEKMGPVIFISTGVMLTVLIVETLIDGELQEEMGYNIVDMLIAILLIISSMSLIVYGIVTFKEAKEAFQLLGEVIKDKFESPVQPIEHLIRQLLKKKNRENCIICISLCLALTGEYILYKTTQVLETSILWMIVLTAVLLLLNLIHYRILKYRVDHGLYGTCRSEARELITFILELQESNGNSKGGMPKLVFTQEELDECLQVNGGEEYAG